MRFRLALLFALLVFTSSAQAQVQAVLLNSCKEWCRASFVAEPETTIRWASPQRFRKNPDLEFDVNARGDIFVFDYVGRSDCRVRFYGAEAVLRVNACGHRLRIRVATLVRQRIHLRYRVPMASESKPREVWRTLEPEGRQSLRRSR